MSNARSTEKDPTEPKATIEIENATIVSVTDPCPVGQSQKFTIVLDITKNPKYPELLAVEFFGRDLPAWYNDLRHGIGEVWRFYGRAKSREYNGKWYTTVTVYWGGARSNQPAKRDTPPPAFDNSPIPPPPRQEYQDEIPF